MYTLFFSPSPKYSIICHRDLQRFSNFSRRYNYFLFYTHYCKELAIHNKYQCSQ